jgi:hypothetical protein
MGGIMRRSTVILIVVTLLVCPAGWSQTRKLGDVAGAIKLNPEAIVEKEGVVEDPRAAKRADENLFGGVLADCSAAAELLGSLVTQARVPGPSRDLDLMNRMESAAQELETAIHSISLLRLSDGFKDPLEIAREAEPVCAGACAGVREVITQGGVMFSNASVQVTRCRQLLDEAKEKLLAIDQPVAPPQDTESTAPPTDDEIIVARCESESAKGAEFVESCQALQYRSLSAMASRVAANEMLDPGVFSDIRQMCLELHPSDFLLRNNCELDKMTATRLEEQ